MTDGSDDEVTARLATQAGELLLGVRDEPPTPPQRSERTRGTSVPTTS
jgi:hypothetical protein